MQQVQRLQAREVVFHPIFRDVLEMFRYFLPGGRRIFAQIRQDFPLDR